MAFINDKIKEINCKIVYFGSPHCGKSTSLRHLYSEVKEKKRGDLVSLSTIEDQTLYFDFIPLNLGKINGYTVRLHLYTVPGEMAYEGARKLISTGVDGVIFVADSALDRMEYNLNSMIELKEMIEASGVDWNGFPLVIQYNKRDVEAAVAVDELRKLLNQRKVPDFETVATEGQGVFDSLKAITRQVLRTLEN